MYKIGHVIYYDVKNLINQKVKKLRKINKAE